MEIHSHDDFLIKAIVVAAVAAVIFVLNEILLRNYLKKNRRPHFVFLQRFVRFATIVILAMVLIAEYWGLTRLVNLLVGSIAIISGVVAFACQSIFRDFFEGLVISVSRPFDIGDRLLLESVDRPCVVEEITVHHVVLKTMDGIRYIVPNSKISSMVIANTSYRQRLRGSFISVSVGMNTDIPKAISLTIEAVKECPLTFPNVQGNADLGGYGDVYLMGFQESGLLLETVIWTEPETDNFLACSQVRSLILQKFMQNGIEIPYNYLNVIEKEEEKAAMPAASSAIRKRNVKIKTDYVEIRSGSDDLNKVGDTTKKYARYHTMPKAQLAELLLMSEEVMLFAENVLGVTTGKFWIEGKKEKTWIHFRTKTVLDKEQKGDLMMLSSTGVNEAKRGFAGWVRSSIQKSDSRDAKKMLTYSGYKEGLNPSVNDDLEMKILTGMADDIKVSIYKGVTEITVVKNFAESRA